MNSNITSLLISLPAVIIAIGFHEAAHAYAAYKCGDNTAKNMGRLTINPLKHLDPIGFIMLFLFHFGWAKPVPINPNNFKNRKKGVILTALAGPVMNILLAIVFAIILTFIMTFLDLKLTLNYVLVTMINAVVSVNVCLAIFNLLPIPPLDGSKIFGGLLPYKYTHRMMEYQNIIQLVMILLLFSGVLGTLISPIINVVYDIILELAALICYGLFKILGL